MTDEDWSRRLRAGVVKLDDAGSDEQNRQQEDDNAHERQCTTSESTDYAEILSVESVESVVKPETRDPSHGPNNSADVSDHSELSVCVRAGIGTAQRCCSHFRRCTGRGRCRRCYESSHKKNKSRPH